MPPKLKNEFRKALDVYQRRIPTVNVIAGRADGIVDVPNSPHQIFVRESRKSVPFAVYNFRVNATAGMKLKIGEDRTLAPGIVQVLSIRWYAGINLHELPTLLIHGPSHYYTGNDPIFVADVQITPLLCYVDTGMIVHFNGGWLVNDGIIFYALDDDIDLTSNIPGSGAQYSLITSDTDGIISVIDGTPVDALMDLQLSDIPQCPVDQAPLAFVRLYAGQTSLSTLIADPDLRPLVYGGGKFRTSYPAGSITYTPAVLADWTGSADPGNVDDALDQLAARLDDVENTPNAGHTIEDETTPMTARTKLSFQGAGVTVTDDAGNDRTVVTIPTGGSPDAADVTYTPAVITDWNGDTDPGNLDDAIDQLAARVDDLEPTNHAAVTLATDADTILGLSGQQVTLDTQGANKVLAGPTTGTDADPSFRALVAADVGTGAPSGSKFLRDDMTWQAPPGGTDADAIHDNVSGEINAITAKTALALADRLLGEDSAASWAKKSMDVQAILTTRLLDVNKTYYVATTGSDSNDGSSGSPFLTIEKAVSMFRGRAVKNCTINIADGSYTENVTIDGIIGAMDGGLTLQGQSGCVLSGTAFLYGDTKTTNISDTIEGVGTITLATDNSGTGGRIRITTTRSTTNPDYDTAGLTTANKIWTYNGTTLSSYNVYAVSNNIITLDSTATAPNLAFGGRFWVVAPSVVINSTTNAEDCALEVYNTGLKIIGIHFSGYYCAIRLWSASVQCSECLFKQGYTGSYYAAVHLQGPSYFFARYDPFLDASITAIGNWAGIVIAFGNVANVGLSLFVSLTAQYGMYCSNGNCYFNNGRIVAVSGTGIYAANGGYVYATGTFNFVWATTTHSPGTTNTLGNNMGSITFN